MNRDRFLGVDRDMRISLKLFLEVVIKRKYYSRDGPLILIHCVKSHQVQRDYLKPNNAVLNIVMVTELNKNLWTSPAPKTIF